MGVTPTPEVLAEGGFVVVAINHPGENAFDRSRVDELSLAAERPVDNKRVIDFMLDSWPDGAKIDRDHIGEFGFSRGGYTTLAVIGGTPDYRRGAGRCPRDLNEGQCNLFRKYEFIPEREATYDPRIKAAVIGDPANSIFFGEHDLKGITIPVQVWASERGGAGELVDVGPGARACGCRGHAGHDFRVSHFGYPGHGTNDGDRGLATAADEIHVHLCEMLSQVRRRDDVGADCCGRQIHGLDPGGLVAWGVGGMHPG